jgi:hypothetical protein
MMKLKKPSSISGRCIARLIIYARLLMLVAGAVSLTAGRLPPMALEMDLGLPDSATSPTSSVFLQASWRC